MDKVPGAHVLVVMLGIGLVSCTPSEPDARGRNLPPAANPPALVPPTEDHYAASHLLVAYAGAPMAPAGTTRTADEAHERIMEVWTRIDAGYDFDALVREMSDAPSAARGGRIGVYRTNTMMPEFEAAIAGVAVGAYTQPFRTAFGWHVARRDPVVEAEGRHLLVSWRGATGSRATRTRSQALARITQIRGRLDAGEAFEVVAEEVGEDATAPHGGALGRVAPGQLIPAFEDALFALDVGELSDVVETPYGFHLVQRTR